ncbi:hypothetical protein [Flavobacterium rhizosphaerae]|uniref:YD repeat-containing protein n=1 Tax=Flavobacterium rhizosphaerae TaxID=3163298 RepID=A0ABW8YTE3_9FLAO
MKNTRYIKTIRCFALWLCITLTCYAQEPTDEEIGFNRDTLRKEILNSGGFVKQEYVEARLDKLRKDAVLRYQLGEDKWFEQQWPSILLSGSESFPDCEKATFNSDISEPLSAGWELWYNIHQPDYNSADDDYDYSDDYMFSVSNESQMSHEDQYGEIRYVVDDAFTDSYMNVGGVNPNNTQFLQIGNSETSVRREYIQRTFEVTGSEDLIFYRFAIVLQDPGHSERPFFMIRILKNDIPIDCSVVNYEAIPNIPGFIQSSSGSSVWVRPWSSNVIRPSDFGAQQGDDIKIQVGVSDCGAGGHFGYGYFDIECIEESDIIDSPDDACLGGSIEFTSTIELFGEDYKWNIYNEATNALVAGPFTAPSCSFIPIAPGNYRAELSVPYFTTSSQSCNVVTLFKKSFSIKNCKPEPCIDCTSFNLLKGDTYLVSGWVKQQDPVNMQKQFLNYDRGYLRVYFTDVSNTLIGQANMFYPSGDIIDGWQRIIGEFTVPPNVDDMHLELMNEDNKLDVFFDDIRVYPSKANLKSFVYDQHTQRLMAELDENNYSTFYEYDKEGGLIRIKKETEKGVFTIQETRTGTHLEP